MFLITKDKPKPRAHCMTCRAFHAERDCPNPEPITVRTLRAREAEEFMLQVRAAKQVLTASR